MNKNKRFIVICLSILWIMTNLFATSTIAGNVKLIVSTAPEFKAEAGYNVRIPMLQGSGPLFSGNNLKLKGLLGVSPIAATLSADAVFTPIAVMEILAGGAIGTGWDFSLMELQGLRKWGGNPAIAAVPDSTGGVYYKGRAGIALQFDTAAIWPGDWTSVLLRTYHEVNYQGYSNASSSSTGGWEYETAGIHQNSFNYKGEYILGYHLPFMVDTVALMLETYKDNIGNNLEIPMVFDLGLILNVQFTDRLNLTVIPQMTTKKVDSKKDGNDTRVISKTDFGFKRVAAMLNYSL